MAKYKGATDLTDRQYEDSLSNLNTLEIEVRDRRRDVANCQMCGSCGFRPANKRYAGEQEYSTVARCECVKDWARAGRTYNNALLRLDREPDKPWLFELPQPVITDPVPVGRLPYWRQRIAAVMSGFGEIEETS